MNFSYSELARNRDLQSKIASGQMIDDRPRYGPAPGEPGFIPPMRRPSPILPVTPEEREQQAQASLFEQEKQKTIRALQTELFAAQQLWQEAVKNRESPARVSELQNKLLDLMMQIDMEKKSSFPVKQPAIRSIPQVDTYIP